MEKGKVEQRQLTLPEQPPSTPSETGVFNLRQHVFSPTTLISLGLAGALLWFIFTQLDLDLQALGRQIAAADKGTLGLAFLSFYATLPLRAIRWRLLLRHAEGKDGSPAPGRGLLGLTEILVLGWFANCIVPAKLGDAYRAYLLKKNSGGDTSFSRTLGTLFAERSLDMITVVSLLGVAAALLTREEQGSHILVILEAGALLLGVLIGALLLLRWAGPRLRRWVPRPLREAYDRLLQGSLESLRPWPRLAALSAAIWVMESGRLYFVLSAQALSVPIAIVVFAALANALLTTIPFTPGGLGLAEAGVAGVLLTVVSQEQAVATAILDRVVSYWSLVALGSLLFLLSRRR
jgi:uncharacterized protein (TIRG00374 family)